MLRKLVSKILIALALASAPAHAAQNSLVTPSVGPMSMGTFVGTYLNPALLSILSNYSGNSAPAVGPGGAPLTYQWWFDTSTSPATLRVYDGLQWISIGTLNTSTHVWTPSNLSFTATGTGAVTRTIASRLGETISVRDYGADPTGVTDSCTAITNAFNAVPAGLSGLGASVYFPNGTYVTTCAPTIADKLVAIVGDGVGMSQITFTSNTAGAAGLSFTYSTPVATLVPQVRNISLVTTVNQTNGNACIKIVRPVAAASIANPGPFVGNIYCGGTGSTYWADGINCLYCNFLSVQKAQIVGAGAGGATVGTNMARGIFLDQSIDVNVYDTHIYFAQKGISLDRASEGMKLDFSSFVMNDWGVYTESTWQAPSLVVANSHFNVTKGGIHIEGGATATPNSQGQIHDNLIYRWLEATTSPWVGVECANGTTSPCSDHRISGNNVIAFQGGGPTGTANCFSVGSNSTYLQIQDNKCRQADYFLAWNSATAATISVNGNSAQTLGTGWFNGANPNATVYGNNPVLAGPSDTAANAVGNNNTAWNLSGVNARVFLTNATAPTTVTDGNGGWPGLTVTIQCNDGLTTIANGTGNTKFALAGGGSFRCTRLGETISFVYSDQWHETGRTTMPPAYVLCGTMKAANFNSTADQAITIRSPTANYVLQAIRVTNPSVAMSAAVGGFYTAASKGGTQIISSSQAYSGITTTSINTSGNMLSLAPLTAAYNLTTIYFSLTTAQGAAATADISLVCAPQP